MQRTASLTDSTHSNVDAYSWHSQETDSAKGRTGSLEYLVYFSTAVGAPTIPQLEHMLMRARERNASEGVTGVLIYAEGLFVQYLEGPRTGIDRVYRHILADSLHRGVFEVLREPIESREFADWQMAFAPTLSSGLAKHFPVNDHLSQRLRASEETLSGARHLLDACWKNGMGFCRHQWCV